MSRKGEVILHSQIWRLFDRRRARGAIGFHPANGGKRSMSEAVEFQGMGLLPGVADLVFVRRDGMAFFLEVKTPKGRLSDVQEEFQADVLNTEAGYAVARSVLEAERALLDWHLIRP